MTKFKINKNQLLTEKGFYWSTRYSDNEMTDKFGRWARIGFFNGLCIAWINGFVKGEEEKLDDKRTGKADFFSVSLFFPISMQECSGHENFDTIEDAKKYVEEMFNDFKKIITK